MSVEKTFGDLPPRVVIYDILPFHLFLFYPTLKSFDLFGYFKKDRSRHVWFLFSSIKIEEKDVAPPVIEDLEIPEEVPEEVVVSFQKIRYLSLNDSSLELLVSFKSRFDDMQNLESIFLRDTRHSSIRDEVGVLWNELLSKETTSKLKSLKRIVIDSNITSLMKDSKLHLTDHPFNNLTELFFSQPVQPSLFNNFFRPLSGKEDDFIVQSEMKKLCIENIFLEHNTKVHFPNLEKLWLALCENLYIETGNKLKNVQFQSIGCELVEEIYRKSTKLKTLMLGKIKFPEEDTNGFILKRSMNPLYELKTLRLVNIHFDTRLENDIFKLSTQLQRLELSKLEDLREDLFLNEFPKLKTLRIENNEIIEGNMGVWPVCKHLKRLYLRGMERLGDDFFRNNEFLKLEKLDVQECGLLKGSGWNAFPKIRSIVFGKCSALEDSFFQEQQLPDTLRKLEVNTCYEVFGKNWSVESEGFRSLKNLKLEACFDMKDHLFQEIEFESLQKLSLNRVHKMKGEGWREMKKLKKVIASIISDELQMKFMSLVLEKGIVLKQEDDGLDF